MIDTSNMVTYFLIAIISFGIGRYFEEVKAFIGAIQDKEKKGIK